MKSFFWFGLGFLTARYLILKNGVEIYRQKEDRIIGKAGEIREDVQDEYFPQ